MSLGDRRKSESYGVAHLQYGGSVIKGSNIGIQPVKGTTFREQRKIEDIIRLENAGFGDKAISGMLCVSARRIQDLKKQSRYMEARLRVTHGIILDRDSRLAVIKEERKEYLRGLLPEALQFLAKELETPARTLPERKFKFALTQDLLDREGTFAKVSKTEIKPVDAFDFEKADMESAAVIEALRGATVQHPQHSIEAITANEKFSNSHTLSAIDQQEALDSLDKEAESFDALALMPTNGEVN